MADAKREVEGLVRAKLAKGYREKKAPAKAKAAPVKSGRSSGAGGAASFAALERSLLPETDVLARARLKKPGAGWAMKVLKAAGIDRLPPSYLEYVARLSRVGEWIIQRKQKRLPNYLEVYVTPWLFANARKILVTVLDMAAENNQAEEAAKWRGLVAFGTDSSRCFFCWDPARVDRRGEPAIVLLDNNADLRVTTIAKDLFELMRSYRQKRDRDNDGE